MGLHCPPGPHLSYAPSSCSPPLRSADDYCCGRRPGRRGGGTPGKGRSRACSRRAHPPPRSSPQSPREHAVGDPARACRRRRARPPLGSSPSPPPRSSPPLPPGSCLQGALPLPREHAPRDLARACRCRRARPPPGSSPSPPPGSFGTASSPGSFGRRRDMAVSGAR
jgi:hypothetical protein